MRLRFFVIGVVLSSLAACASYPTTMPTPEAMTKVIDGQSSALITNMGGDLNCSMSFIGIHRAGAAQNEVLNTHFEAGYDTTTPAMIVVEPGRYKISGVSCFRDGYYPSDLPNLARWFGYVEVGQGEVVYIGSLIANRLDFRTRSSFDNPVAAFFLAGENDTESTYLTYELVDNPEVAERLEAIYPDLQGRIVFRAPRQIISRDVFVELLEQAFAPDSDGTLPTLEEANARFMVAIDRKFGATPIVDSGPATQ